MRILRRSDKNLLFMSKKDWEQIGIKHGWLKKEEIQKESPKKKEE